MIWTVSLVLCTAYMACWLVYIIHCNLWYWRLPREERKRLNQEDRDLFW